MSRFVPSLFATMILGFPLQLIYETKTIFAAEIVPAETPQEKPVRISGIYPHLAMFNNEAECGTGAVVAWADRLWAITYGPHSPHGSSDRLYEITPDLEQIIRPESVGGTHANRMIHKESKQLILGPYFVDEQRNVRVVSPKIMPGRLTGNARHLSDPAGKVYFTTMEEGLYEVDVRTLEVVNFIKDGNPVRKDFTVESGISTLQSKLPGYHGKGTYSGQGRVVYANNGDQGSRVMFDPTVDSGALAQWTGSGDWELVRRNQFTEVSGPGGIFGNENPETDPIWSIGWDHRSLILMVLDGGRWTVFRLPKASHTYDGAHGWHTEWPRIRDVGGETLLMTMHGTFWHFPKTFSAANTAGILPRSTYLKVIGDFCRWNDQVVFACDDTARAEFTNKRKAKGHLAGPGQSQSNLWFVEPAQLDGFGPKLGRGGPWVAETVQAGTYCDPYLFNGYEIRMLYLRHEEAVPVAVVLEVDVTGTGDWKALKTIAVPPGDSGTIEMFDADTPGIWIRLKTDRDVRNMTAQFQYRGPDRRTVEPSPIFRGLATLEDDKVGGGILHARGGDFKTLRFVARNETGELGVYDLDADLTLKRKDDSQGLDWTKTNAAIPVGVLDSDEASVLLVDDKGRWRLPKGDPRRDRDGVLGEERVCREVATERDLFHAHGTFYELPAENSGGVQKIRPIASHPYRIKDYASYRGLLVMGGVSGTLPEDDHNPHIVRSDDGRCALWCGVIDDLWQLGKPRGVGGPWKKSDIKAGEPSDPYLMAGYDQKTVELAHDAEQNVAFRIELDVCGTGTWTSWKTVRVEPGKTQTLDISVDGYWVRFVADKDTRATATLTYK